jgi:hypothetical protein
MWGQSSQTRVVELLRELATAGRTITYEELRERLGLEGDLVPVLRAVSIAEDEAGRGLLSAVVVQAQSGRPGAGWFRLAAERGRDVSDEDAAWQAERRLLSAR